MTPFRICKKTTKSRVTGRKRALHVDYLTLRSSQVATDHSHLSVGTVAVLLRRKTPKTNIVKNNGVGEQKTAQSPRPDYTRPRDVPVVSLQAKRPGGLLKVQRRQPAQCQWPESGVKYSVACDRTITFSIA